MNSLRRTLKNILLVLAVFACGFVSGCGTVYGVVSDINLASGWAQKQLRPVQDSMEEQRVRRAAELVLEQQDKQSSSVGISEQK